MRPRGLVLAALLVAGGPVAAQAPPPPPLSLDECLQRWEQKMQQVQTLQAQLTRVEKDPSFNKVQEYIGYAQYMKEKRGAAVVSLATLEMRPKAKPNEIAEKFICTGTHLYQFDVAAMEVRQYELPKPKPGQVAQDNIMGFMFGMRAADARERYDLKLTKEDQYYVYIDILPRLPQDKADFTAARVVLNKDTFLPRELRFQHSGSDVLWDIPYARAGVEVKRTDFDAPKVEKPWKLTIVPRQDGQPKVIRSGGP
jgi:TIGR03009 family protein